jgi:hypothetical protein
MNFAAKIINYAFEFPVRFLFYFFISFTTLYGLSTYTYYKLSSSGTLSDISLLLLLGIIAGILQIIGYIIYILHEDIDPNPVTWFMFAYGTAILTILEWDMEATLPELILPATCSIFAIYVSLRCWINARKRDPSKWWPEDWWPSDRIQQLSFVSDIIITIGYVAIWAFVVFGTMSPDTKLLAVFWFLLLSNLSTFPAFYPIIHETYKHPEKENFLPWFIWAAAYGLLGIVTYVTHEELFGLLMLYPVSNALLHAVVGIVALRKKRGF